AGNDVDQPPRRHSTRSGIRVLYQRCHGREQHRHRGVQRTGKRPHRNVSRAVVPAASSTALSSRSRPAISEGSVQHAFQGDNNIIVEEASQQLSAHMVHSRKSSMHQPRGRKAHQ
ncbi:Adenylate cyclase, partial [Trypanosoma cruzi]